MSNTQNEIERLQAVELKAQSERHERAKFELLVARLVVWVDALEGEPIMYTLGKNLAVANDAVRVALGNPSRLKTSEAE